MRGFLFALLCWLPLTLSAADIEPASPIPPYKLIRVTLAPGERCWILSSTFEPVDVQYATAESMVIWTAPPGKYAVLSWTETTQGQQIVEIGGSGPPDPQAPIARDDVAITAPNTVVVIAVLANDTDPDGDIDPGSVMVAVAPMHGTAIPQPNGAIVYTPRMDYVGEDTFSYHVADSRAKISNRASVNVTIEGGQPPPEIPNQYEVGLTCYQAALAVGKPAEALQLATAVRAGIDLLNKGGTPAMADAVIKLQRQRLSSGWKTWQETTMPTVKAAMIKHGGGPMTYRNYLLEMAVALETAGKA